MTNKREIQDFAATLRGQTPEAPEGDKPEAEQDAGIDSPSQPSENVSYVFDALRSKDEAAARLVRSMHGTPERSEGDGDTD